MRRALSVAIAPAAPYEGGPPWWLTESERARYERLRPSGRGALMVSRWLARCLLARVAGGRPAQWRLRARDSAPPCVDQGPVPDAPLWHISISHRRDWVAVAVSDLPVGVDVECGPMSPTPVDERAALILTPAERARFDALGPADREQALLGAWVLKEAWYKSCHPRLAPYDFRRIEVEPAAGRSANARHWTLADRGLWVGLSSNDGDALALTEVVGLAVLGEVTHRSWHVQAAS